MIRDQREGVNYDSSVVSPGICDAEENNPTKKASVC